MKKLLLMLVALLSCFCMTTTALAYDMGKVGQNNFVSSGYNHTTVIKSDGSLWGWGIGTFREYSDSPLIPTKLMDGAVSVVANVVNTADHTDVPCSFTAVLKNDGSLWTFGNSFGGFMGTSGAVTKVMDGVAAIAGGDEGFLTVIKTDGSLWIWGSAWIWGSTWIWNPDNAKQPKKVMDNVTAVSTSGNVIAAIKTDKSLWMWGVNSDGQLGNGGKANEKTEYGNHLYQSTPIKIMDDVVSVCAGDDHTAAIKTDGSLWTWGANGYGQLGNGGIGNETRSLEGTDLDTGKTYRDEYPIQTTPIKVMDGAKFVSTGVWTTAVVKTDGSLWMWGNNADGQLGNGKTGNRQVEHIRYTGDGVDAKTYTIQDIPVKIMDEVSMVSAGQSTTAIVKNDGSLWMCGSGWLGTKNDWENSVSIPVKVMDGVALANNSVFSDVYETAWYFEPVKWAVDKGIANGTGEGTFSPDMVCNQAQILSFLWRAYGEPEPTISNPFSSISADKYYYKAAIWAYEAGIISGTDFQADTKATRSMAISCLWKAANCPGAASATHFKDVPAGADYAQAVDWAVAAGITSGTSAELFSPDTPCSRATILTFLYRTVG